VTEPGSSRTAAKLAAAVKPEQAAKRTDADAAPAAAEPAKRKQETAAAAEAETPQPRRKHEKVVSCPCCRADGCSQHIQNSQLPWLSVCQFMRLVCPLCSRSVLSLCQQASANRCWAVPQVVFVPSDKRKRDEAAPAPADAPPEVLAPAPGCMCTGPAPTLLYLSTVHR
jgi:hypothetical protein